MEPGGPAYYVLLFRYRGQVKEKVFASCTRCAKRLPFLAPRFRVLQRQFDRFVHPLDELEIHLIPNSFRNLFQIFLILLWKDNRLNPRPHPCQDLLFDPSYRKDQTS